MKDCNCSCQTDPFNIITSPLACTPGMGVSRCYEEHLQSLPNLRWLGREWQGALGSCVTKEQTADCQMEEFITYTWNPLYIALSGNSQGRQPAQKEVSANIGLLIQEWFHGKLGAGRSGQQIAEQQSTVLR